MMPAQSSDTFIRTTEVIAVLQDWVILPLRLRIKVDKLTKINLKSDFVETTKRGSYMVVAFLQNAEWTPHLVAYVKGTKLYIKSDTASSNLSNRDLAEVAVIVFGKRWDTLQLNNMLNDIGG